MSTYHASGVLEEVQLSVNVTDRIASRARLMQTSDRLAISIDKLCR